MDSSLNKSLQDNYNTNTNLIANEGNQEKPLSPSSLNDSSIDPLLKDQPTTEDSAANSNSSSSEPTTLVTTDPLTSDPSNTNEEKGEKISPSHSSTNLSFSTSPYQKPNPPLRPEDFPSSYSSNNEREEKLLQFVSNFRRQYVTLFPHRKELLLSIENEFKIKKFVCATIRPTLLKFKEFYDYRSCARFLADYITYEPLNPPFDLPSILQSPSLTLRLQRGNAFDISIVLCSFLRGSGFDAYVVSGYATRQITLMDETNVDAYIDQLMQEWEMNAPTVMLNFSLDSTSSNLKEAVLMKKESKYKVKTKSSLTSKYLLHMEAKRKLEEEKKEAKRLEALKQQYAPKEESDELAGLRIHAWVLVLPGKRDVSEAFFIEPSSGKIYDLEHPHYLGVESVFSSSNYWVNMQKCTQGLKSISFDLNDTTKWEFLFLQRSHPAYTPDLPVEEEEEEEENEKVMTDTDKELMEVGPSWVLPLHLSKEQLASQCPSGSKTFTWRNAKLEIFAPYSRTDGLVTRLTVFADAIRHIQGTIHERYKHRKDRLWKRVKRPSQGLQHEFFEHGRPHALEEHVMMFGNSKELRFYRGSRSDGLYLHQERDHKIIEHFEGRSDRLIYRSVTYDPCSDGQTLSIYKMCEHFARRHAKQKYKQKHETHDEEKKVEVEVKEEEEDEKGDDEAEDEEELGPGDEVLDVACNEIYKRVYYIRDEKMKVVYHVNLGSLFPGFREFRKPSSDQKASLLELTSSFETIPPKKPPKKQHLYARMCDLLKAEQACLAAVKASDREVKEILASRYNEEKNIQLVISLFDTIRNTFDITSEMQKESQKQAEEACKEASIDYLSPFLLHYVKEDGSLKLTKDEAMQVRDHCLKSLKERLIEKSSIIQKRYEEETSAYQKRQQYYSKNSETMNQVETEEYVQFCNDALFRIHVLEKRLAKHKETAPELYLALDRKLNSDPRLAPLLSGN